MRVEDLRIGNYMQDNRDGNLLMVLRLERKAPDSSHSSMGYHVVDRSKYPLKKGYLAEPIPLTEEWLIKFGFKRLGVDTFYLGSVKVHHRKRGFVLARRYGIINHVHQLQNIYFALLQKEL